MTPGIAAAIEAIRAAAATIERELTPAPPAPTYALSAPAATVDEGASITVTLQTTGVPAGGQVPYILAGAAATPEDLETPIAGAFTVGADGSAQAAIRVRADLSTEGNETLVLGLANGAASIAFNVTDTSTTPAPAEQVPWDVRPFAVNRAAAIHSLVWHGKNNGTSYWRYLANILPEAVSPSNRRITVAASNFTAGTWRSFARDRYTLLIDGEVHATFDPVASAHTVDVDVDVLRLTPDWHWVSVGDETGAPLVDESPMPFPLLVMHGSEPSEQAKKRAPLVMGNFDWLRRCVTGVYWAGLIPADCKPVSSPLAPREFRSLDGKLDRQAQLWREHFMPVVDDRDVYHLRRSRIAGIKSAYCDQRYAVAQLMAKKPAFDQLAHFMRGEWSLAMVTHITIGTAVVPELIGKPGIEPDGFVGNLYVLTPWAGYRISSQGVGNIMFGLAQQEPGGPWRRYGIWPDDVPEDERDLNEPWGMCVDQRTLALVTTDERVLLRGVPFPPHVTGVRWIVADTRNKRLVSAKHARDSHEAEPHMSIMLRLPGEIFDVVNSTDSDKIIISEREGHRVTERLIDNPETVTRVIAEGPNLSWVRQADRRVIRTASLDELRRHPIVGPEGLFLQDGWVSVSSWAQQQTRRFNLQGPTPWSVLYKLADGGGIHKTKFDAEPTVEELDALAAAEAAKRSTDPVPWTRDRFIVTHADVLCNLSGDDNSHFGKHCQDDGTMRPRGWVHYCTWASLNAGLPFGVPTNFNQGNIGPGLPWHTFGYASAVAQGRGRMYTSASSEGMYRFTAAEAGTEVVSIEEARAMYLEYEARGYHMEHGPHGYGRFGRPKPWGVSPRIDKLLRLNGHMP